MKICMGFDDIAGYYTNLERGFRSIGIYSEFIELQPHRFSYSKGIKKRWFVNFFAELQRLKMSCGYETLVSRLKRNMLKISQGVLLVYIFLWSIMKFDVFIFGANSFAVIPYSLKILHFFRKKIICVYHGSDARPIWMNWKYIHDFDSTPSNVDRLCRHVSYQKKLIRYAERYANVIINHPPTALLNQKPFVLWLALGIPFATDFYDRIAVSHDEETLDEKNEENVVRILHCPSHAATKGSDLIRAIINNLESKGYSINYIELSNVLNEEVLNEIAKCDFVLDQAYSDTPMAGFASEAAAFSKPAIVGGYYFKKLKEDHHGINLPISVYCRPEELELATEKMINNPEQRVSLGKEANAFLKANWDAKTVAMRFMKLVEGDIPKEWVYDPSNIQTIDDNGISFDMMKYVVGTIINSRGIESLQLSDKPHVEEIILKNL